MTKYVVPMHDRSGSTGNIIDKYGEILLYQDKDPRLVTKNGYCIKQMNERIYLTREQLVLLYVFISEELWGVE